MNMLTFDPGKTTGWSYWKNRNLVEVGAVLTYQDLLICFGQHSDVDTVVFEGFARANASTGDQLQAIEMCGAIQCLATAAKATIKKQYPANRKGYIPCARQFVKEMNLPQDIRPHVTDAVAHGVCYLHKNFKEPWAVVEEMLQAQVIKE